MHHASIMNSNEAIGNSLSSPLHKKILNSTTFPRHVYTSFYMLNLFFPKKILQINILSF